MAQKVLIVDDDEDVRTILTMRLKKAGYEVGRAPDGAQGFDLLQSGQWDLVLLDLMMPGLNGFEFLDRVKEQLASHPPIVIVTQLDDMESRQRCLDAGAFEYVSKTEAFSKDFIPSLRLWLSDAA